MTLRDWLQAHPRGERDAALRSLAEAAGVKTAEGARHWVNGIRQVPGERVLAVEAHTGVSRYVLRPDIYGPADTAAA